jgi:hypothetical protein
MRFCRQRLYWHQGATTDAPEMHFLTAEQVEDLAGHRHHA